MTRTDLMKREEFFSSFRCDGWVACIDRAVVLLTFCVQHTLRCSQTCTYSLPNCVNKMWSVRIREAMKSSNRKNIVCRQYKKDTLYVLDLYTLTYDSHETLGSLEKYVSKILGYVHFTFLAHHNLRISLVSIYHLEKQISRLKSFV